MALPIPAPIPADEVFLEKKTSRSISLVAMPGAGKSTAGRHLAASLRLPLYDADAEIERRLGMSIRSFFEREGEDAFRDVEEQVIADLVQRPAGVIATGGGVVLRPANRQALRDNTTVVYLRANPDELYRRLRHDRQRPLLQVADPLRRLRDLFQERDPLYRATAHYIIETGRPSVASLVNMIRMQLELAGLVPTEGPVEPARPPHTEP